MAEEANLDSAVAIIGIAARFPGAMNHRELWANLVAGRETVRFFSEDELTSAGVDPRVVRRDDYVRARGVLDRVEEFNNQVFGLTRAEAELLDPQHRNLLELGFECFQDSGYHPAECTKTSVYCGVGMGSESLAGVMQVGSGSTEQDAFARYISSGKDFAATRLANRLGLRGAAVGVQTACSTSLVAVHLAVQSLLTGEVDLALAGGASVVTPTVRGYRYSKDFILSKDGHTRPFEAGATGTVFSDGAGLVLLKRYEDALRDGDACYALVLGSAINNDGSDKVGFTAPSVSGQAAVIRDAMDVAGVAAPSIGMLEAHGTGTPVGDPIEVQALTRAFATTEQSYCALGSIKGNFGHTDAAAGIAGLIKAALCLKRRTFVPTIHFETPNPRINFDETPFFVSKQTAPWAPACGVRRAGVSAFGIGGTNAHVVLQEAPQLSPRRTKGACFVWPVSAPSAKGLAALARDLSEHMDAGELPLQDVELSLRVRHAFDFRRAIVASDGVTIREQLGALASEGAAAKPELPLAFLFSGQGSQSPGVGRELYEELGTFRETFDRCASMVRRLLDVDLRQCAFGTQRGAIDDTWLTQPLLFALEYSLAQQLIVGGLRPAAVAGHSVGEWVAACLGGVFSLEDALRLVTERARLLWRQPPGRMASLPLSLEETLELLSRYPWGQEIDVAAVNARHHCVVAASEARVDGLMSECARLGIKSRKLHTSHAFHSRLIEGAVEPFERAVRSVQRQHCSIPFVSTVSGEWLSDENARDPKYWSRQIREPVRFASATATLQARGRFCYLEVGPGSALAQLARADLPSSERRWVVPTLGGSRSIGDWPSLSQALGRAWEAGHEVNWGLLKPLRDRRRVQLPATPLGVESTGPVGATPTGKRPAGVNLVGQGWEPFEWVCGDSREHGSVLLLATERSSQVERILRARVQQLHVVAAGDLSGGDPVEAVHEVMARCRREGSPVDLVVDLWPTLEPDGVRQQALTAGALLRGFLEPRHAGTWWSFVVDRCDAAGASRGRPAYGVWMAGVASSVSREHGGLSAHLIQLSTVEALPSAVGDLLGRTGGAQLPVRLAWREGQWFRLASEPSGEPWQAGTAPLSKGAHCLLTGGLGGVAQLFARHLAAAYGARLTLVDCRVPDSAEATCRALERLGADAADAVTADVADPRALREVVSEAERKHGAIDAVIHAAGVAGGGLLSRLDWKQFDAVLRPKLRGSVSLLEALPVERSPLVIFCSSITAVHGGLGESAYSGANAFLDEYARALRNQGVRATSVQWSPFAEVGMGLKAEEQRVKRRDGSAFFELGQDEGDDAPVQTELTAAHWVFFDHRVGNVPLLPGTGHVEFILRALAARMRCPIELTELRFERPLQLEFGQRRTLRVRLVPTSGRVYLETASQVASDGLDCHSRAKFAPLGASAGGRLQLADIRERCARRIAAAEQQLLRVPREQIYFGRQWQENDVTLHVGEQEMLIEIEGRGDTQGYLFHPALMDLATGFARVLVEVSSEHSELYLPIAYERLEWFHPVPSKLVGHCILRERDLARGTIRFDVSVADDNGKIAARLSGFTLKRITSALPRKSRRAGLSNDEALAALDHVLSGAPPVVQVVACEAEAEARLPSPPSPRPRADTAVEARPDLAVVVHRLVARYLGDEHFDDDQDLEELGASSLTLVQIASAIREQLEVELAMDSLLSNPTVNAIVTSLEQELGASSTHSPETRRPTSQGELVRRHAPAGAEFSRARPDEPGGDTCAVNRDAVRRAPLVVELRGSYGKRPPLFCFHPAGGSVLAYVSLISHLDPDQPVLAIQGRGVEDDEEPDGSIASMGEHYLSIVRSIQPRGPYFLCGLSLGGMVAFDIVHRLQAEQQSVGWLGMIDTPGPGQGVKRQVNDDDSLVLDFVRRLAPNMYTAFSRLAERNPRFLETWRLHNRALADYVAVPTEVKIHFFRADERDDLIPDHPEHGWLPLARDGMEVQPVPGNHLTMTAEPHASVLGAKLRRSLGLALWQEGYR